MNEINDQKTATKLHEAVEEVLVENNLQTILYFSKIQKHWDILVGKPLAAKTSPNRLVHKTLYVIVEDAAYSHHLAYFEKNIIDLISSPEICGEGAVDKIRFRVGKRPQMKENKSSQNSDSKIKTVRSKNKIGEKARQAAENINDTKLKNAFARFMSVKTEPDEDKS